MVQILIILNHLCASQHFIQHIPMYEQKSHSMFDKSKRIQFDRNEFILWRNGVIFRANFYDDNHTYLQITENKNVMEKN